MDVARVVPSMLITPDTRIAELLNAHPEADEVLARFGLHCLGCPVSEYGTLRDGAETNSLDVQELVAALQDALPGSEPPEPPGT
jgi:hybrid cluster-associated redox disulfide protein